MTGSPAPSTARRQNISLGILLMIGATMMFALSNAISKWLVTNYPVGEILFVRTVVSLAVIAAVILPRRGLGVFSTLKPGAHVARSVSQAAAQTSIIIAFSLMSLAGAVAIAFAAPLFATLASAIFLREAVGRARWIALTAGFVGVLIVTNPGAEAFQIGAVFALGNAILYGSVTAGVRGMTRTESAETLIMYQHAILTLIFAGFLVFGVRWPASGFDAALLMFNGITNAFGQYWWTRALHLAPAAAVSPFYYFMLVWAAMLGFAIWGELPTVGLMIGSAIVVGSGLFLFWHERRKAARDA
jgi:drug/metabolite transporter (DMT)-like permease